MDACLQARVELNKALKTHEDRVHSVFSITVKNSETVAKITFLVLAGSEKVMNAASEKQRLQESIIINNSFITLTKILGRIWQEKLGDEPEDGQKAFFDSKLTRVLQPVLTPQTEISVICFIYPLENNYQDTLNTVRLPDRIKGIHFQDQPAKVVFSPVSSVSHMPGIDEDEFLKQQALMSQLAEENIALKAKLDQ